MNERSEYYSRLLLWIEAMRLACRADSFISKLCRKEDELTAIEDPFAADFGDAAYCIAEGTISGCEKLLQNAVTYGYKHLELEPYHLSDAAIPLLVEELLKNSTHLDYYASSLRDARKKTVADGDYELITLEEIEHRYRHKIWRHHRIREGLGVGGDLFEEEWRNGIDGRPPLRKTVPWLEAWLNFNQHA